MPKNEKTKETEEVKVPSVLAYKRIINVSNGLFYQKSSVDEKKRTKPLKIMEKVGTRGVDNTRKEKGKEEDALHSNLHHADYCFLDNDNDTVILKYNIQFIDTPLPYLCNDKEAYGKLKKFHKDCCDQGIYKELAYRYIYNIANGRSLWRNYFGASEIKVKITMEEEVYEFDSLKNFSRENFGLETDLKDKLLKISNPVAEVFEGKKPFLNLSIEIISTKHFGSEVYPSQELFTEKSTNKVESYNKRLTNIDGQAAMHPQKISNSLHWIDTWYPAEEDTTPLPRAVTVYSVNTFNGTLKRKGSKTFYELFKPIFKNKKPEENDTKFVAAMLIHGGLFQENTDKTT
jgi:CRISPR-associated protein Csy3